MQYRKNRRGEPLSVLGYGCMRFSKKGVGIDIDKTEKEILAAYEAGVNYYDTAYLYPGSEAALGEILERNHLREKVNVATKLPQYMVRSGAQIEKIFQEELTRLRTTWIDYYLMHHVTNLTQWEKLKSYGILDWIKEKKESGQIRNIGFSFHGNTDSFLEVLNDYDWDFCQIQYNYWDELSQAGKAGLKTAAAKGIPVVIMEPLRGGKLVDMLPNDAKALIAKDPCGYTPAELGFRWLFSQEEVSVVLSGMNSLEMVKENVRVASETTPGSFTEENFALVEKVKECLNRSMKVGCTECRYCMPCPKHVDIPGTFRCYNRMYAENKFSGRQEYFQTVALATEPSFASQCVECGKCEQHCPQHIAIREKLKEADKELRAFPYNVAIKVGRKFMAKAK